MKKTISLILLAALVLSLSAGTCLAAEGEKEESFLREFTFTTTDLNGNTVTEELFAENKVTVVNLFASWCGPCRKEIPYFNKAYEAYQQEGVGFIGIWFPSMDTEENVKAVVEKLGITYPVIAYSEDMTQIPEPSAVPCTFFVDSRGNSIDVTYEEIEAYIIRMYRQIVADIESGYYDSFFSSEIRKKRTKAAYEAALAKGDFQEEAGSMLSGYPGGVCGSIPEDLLLLLIADRLTGQ